MSTDTENQVRVAPLRLTKNVGRLDDMGIETHRVTGGSGPVPASTIDGEASQATFSTIARLIAAKDTGAQTLIDGGAIVTFTDRRVFGLVIAGQGLGSKIRLGGDGSGNAIAFTLFRQLFDEVEGKRGGMRNKVRGVTLYGGAFGLSLDATGLMQADGSFKRSDNDALLSFATGWVAAGS